MSQTFIPAEMTALIASRKARDERSDVIIARARKANESLRSHLGTTVMQALALTIGLLTIQFSPAATFALICGGIAFQVAIGLDGIRGATLNPIAVCLAAASVAFILRSSVALISYILALRALLMRIARTLFAICINTLYMLAARLERSVEGLQLVALARVTAAYAWAILSPIFVYLWRARNILLAVAVTDWIALHFIAPLPSLPMPLDNAFRDVYIGEFVGMLSFAALVLAVANWKLTTIENRLVTQYAYIRAALYRLEASWRVQTAPQTQGSIAMLTMAEDLDRAIVHGPGLLDLVRYQSTLQTLVATPEGQRIPVSLLVALMGPVAGKMTLDAWTAAIGGALRWTIYAALASLSFVLLGDACKDPKVLWFSVIPLILGLQSTTRFISANAPRLPPAIQTRLQNPC